jgi:2-polyprenyl-3-methyl-5-hydroxy-6-metoxy-1,4-benzoquinol methylase
MSNGRSAERTGLMLQYFYDYAILPHDHALLERIDQAAFRLSSKLQTLNLIELGISEYNQRYLGNYICNLRGILQINTYLLAWSLANLQLPVEECVLVDYGGGPGLLTFLAKEMGLKTVIYNDIYEISCQDAEKVGRAIGNEAQAYIKGDIDQLIAYLSQNGLYVDAISSYDVIEHIYDIEGYFRKIKNMPHRTLRVVFASSANSHNPIIKRNRMNGQIMAENKDKEFEWGHKERDSLRSYLAIRREIIKDYAPSFSPEIVDQLAFTTRGLCKNDIENCVDEYRKKGKIVYSPKHPTNTCDPLTGNWSEQLIDTDWIEQVFWEEGFIVSIMSGCYCFTRNKVKQFIKSTLNLLLRITEAKKLWLAPYYVVFAELKK